MEFICAEEKQWKEIKTIYMEAFPKRERKPYFALRHSVKTKKAVVMAATEGEQVLGFIVLIPYKDMVMADYLAVSSKSSQQMNRKLYYAECMQAVQR